MSMSLGAGLRQKAEINITPMIDVLLVLIIIFMVIAPVTPRGLRALIPEPAGRDRRDAAPAHPIVISVAADGSVRLNQDPVELESLQDCLALLFKQAADGVVFVRGEGDLEFRYIARVIDIAKAAGLERIALMTA